ncbi:MAG: hypothetical protein HY350_05030 [Candidatus Omnitrophica bacterium]|nr:hypothetical protein [Candidatus Omnitrophota bacterium]
MQERAELKEKYRELSNEALLDMLIEGKQAYVEGAYELLLQEVKNRGLENKLEEILNIKIETTNKPLEDNEATKADTYVELIIINNEQDSALLESILDGTDVTYYFQTLSFRQKDLPVALMVEESRVEEAIGLFKGFQSKESIILW